MKRSLLKFLLLSPFVLAGYGCGGGGSGESAQTLAEGVAPEDILPEDLDFANRDLVPETFIVVTPRVGAGTGSSWVTWPESLALNVLDENNLYENDDQALSWPSADGGIYSSRADCSGYVTRSLMKAFEFTAEDLQTWMGSKGPSSARYHDNIAFQNNFQRIRRASDVQRGDILASKYLDQTGGGTGHTMIAAGTPVLRTTPSEPSITGTVQYELRIIDSNASPHSTDSRKGTGANGADQTGAGLGTMRLYADASSGQIVGYTWSLSSGSDYYTATSPTNDRRSLVVGRMAFTQ
jgi:hypothetical protein